MNFHICRSCLFVAALAAITLNSSLATGQDETTASDVVQRVIQLRSEGEEVLPAITDAASEQLAINPLVNEGPVVSFDAIDSVPTPKLSVDSDNVKVEVATPPEPRVAQNPLVTPQVQLMPQSRFAPQSQFTPQTQFAPSTEITPQAPVRQQVPSHPISWSGKALSPAPGISPAPMRRKSSTPAILTEISSPEYVNVGELAKVTIHVTNPGQITIHDIQLKALVPEQTKVNPIGGILDDNQCVYEISSLQPGEERKLTLELTPNEKQPLNITTQMSIADRGRIQIGVRKPQLELSIQGPTQANIGSTTTHTVTIANTGDGVARNVRLEADFPDQLRFVRQAGMNSPKTLVPGQKMKVEVTSMPQAPGTTNLTFVAAGTSVSSESQNTSLRVTQPELRVAAVGPDMNFVQRDGIYTISIENPGEVDVNEVSVRFDIPKGVKVTTISRPAKMDARNNQLTWKFDKIESQSQRTIQLKAIATTEGEKICQIVIDSSETAEKSLALKTIIATRADLSIRMKNVGGPVQVGAETEFVVIVENRGSNTASNMEIQIQLPEGLRPKQPEEGIIDDTSNSILFSDSNLAPGKTREFKFSAIGVQKGEQVVRSSLQSVGSEQRIISENSIYVYEPAQARVSESLSPNVAR